MLLERGTIFLHRNFVFKDGCVGEKYLILLNTPRGGDPCLLLKTTSQQKDKPVTLGCIEKRGLYFLQGGTSFFPLNTWVQLFEIYEEPDLPNDDGYQSVSNIKSTLLEKIIDCLFKSQADDITPYRENLIRPCGNSFLDLKQRFDKYRL